MLQARRYAAKNTIDFADPTGQRYVAPQMKPYKPSHSFIQNAIANKAKTSLNGKNSSGFDARKAQLIQDFHNAGLSFRALTRFKNALFDYGLATGGLKHNHLLPIADFNAVKTRGDFQGCLAGTAGVELEARVLEDIGEEDLEGKRVNL